ncbi:MAG: hypothetical protein ABIR52_04055 [Casimicrobiaceae bacterium]
MTRTAVALLSLVATGWVAAAPVTVVNPGFESTKPGIRGDPEGWTGIQHAGPLSYTFKLDAEVRHDGDRSLRIDNIGPEPFGAVFQQLPAAALRGKTLKLSAWLGTRDVVGSGTGGGAVLTLQGMQGGATIAHNHMKAVPVKGTTDWKRYEITLAIPAAADQVEIGAMLHGPGALWVDDVVLEIE